jgi:hypothetical protein
VSDRETKTKRCGGKEQLTEGSIESIMDGMFDGEFDSA